MSDCHSLVFYELKNVVTACRDGYGEQTQDDIYANNPADPVQIPPGLLPVVLCYGTFQAFIRSEVHMHEQHDHQISADQHDMDVGTNARQTTTHINHHMTADGNQNNGEPDPDEKSPESLCPQR